MCSSVFSKFSKHFPGVSWAVPGHFHDISTNIPGTNRRITGTFQDITRRIPGHLQLRLGLLRRTMPARMYLLTSACAVQSVRDGMLPKASTESRNTTLSSSPTSGGTHCVWSVSQAGTPFPGKRLKNNSTATSQDISWKPGTGLRSSRGTS